MESQKKLFAMLIAKGNDPFESAIDVLDGDRDTAIDVFLEWQKDPAVIKDIEGHTKVNVKQSESATGDLQFDEFNKELLSMFRSRHIDVDSRLKAGKMFAEINGYIKKAEAITNVQVNNTQSPVMIVHRNDNPADWSNRLSNNQKQLMDASAEVVEIEDVG